MENVALTGRCEDRPIPQVHAVKADENQNDQADSDQADTQATGVAKPKGRREKSWLRRLGRLTNPIHHRIIAISGATLDWTLRHLPVSWAPRIAVFAARGAYLFARPRVEARGLENLAYAFGEAYDLKERKALLWRGYRGQAICLMEAMALSRNSDLVRQRITNWPACRAKFQAVLKEGRGLILVGGHFGSWEINNQAIATEFALACVAKRTRSEAINRLVQKMRERQGGSVIYHDENPRKLLTALKENKIIGILGDHAFKGVTAMTPPFFGHPTRMPSSPFALARASRAPLMFISTVRSDDGTYLVELSEPMHMEVQGDRDENTYRLMCAWAQFLESGIRANPESWLPIVGYWKKEQAQATVR